MKKNFQKLISLVTLICILTSAISMNSFAIEDIVIKDSENLVLSNEKIENINESIATIEESLSVDNTDVLTELQKQKDFYSNLLNGTTDEKRRGQIISLIETTDLLMNEYKEYKNSANTRGTFHLVYSPAVASVVAYFNLKNYDLATELLTHSRDNNELDSIYYPINGHIVEKSDVFTKIKTGLICFGTNSFPNSGDKYDLDLYYALHSFYYSKSQSSNVVVIQDRYDYENTSWTSVANVAVDTMHEAQEAGVIVPFYSVIIRDFNNTRINQKESVNFGFNDRFYEKRVTLGKGEYKDFTLTFVANGPKVIQTVGSKDTVLELYDESGKMIESNDDFGYIGNAFIKRQLYANVHYKLRVRFYGSSVSGETKLLITPSNGATKNGDLRDYDDIYETTSSNFTFNTFTEANFSRLFVYTPQTTRTYAVETVGNIDTYIYLIDPRSTLPCRQNDDGGELFNAKISCELTEGINYLIVYSAYNMMSTDGKFALYIHTA